MILTELSQSVFGFYSVPACLICLIVLFLLAATPIFRLADTPPSFKPRRILTLDGLRGFLALAVVFHHIPVNRIYQLTGQWSDPPTRFYTYLGQLGIGLFFAITGFLFWSRLLREHGKPDWLNLYVGRIFRVGPLFVVAFAGVTLLAFALTGFQFHVRFFALAHELSRCLTLGLLNIPDINGLHDTPLLLDGVVWTLRYEWLFYLSLPLLSFAAGSHKMHLWFVVTSGLLALVLLSLVHSPQQQIAVRSICFFIAGMLAGSLRQLNWNLRLSDTVSSVLVMALILLALAFEQHPLPQVLVIALLFGLIAFGSTIFGLLTSRPARRLGDISYGIYLLQGFPQDLIFRVPYLRAITLGSTRGQWMLAFLSTIVLLLLATLAHVVIERPGIALGKKLLHSLKRRQSASPMPVQAR